jgi:NAD(P)-dependent dehydrogenase (short-subunit alcohol dehydrogenase family)
VTATALVTGGTGGIGSAVVRRLAADGYRVVFTGRDATRAAAISAATGAVFVAADAADRAACDASLQTAFAVLGSVDLLVANAGMLVTTPLAETPTETFELLVETNLTSVFRYARAVFEPMCLAGRGVICVVASDAAIRGSHRVPAYSVVKAAAVTVAELFGAEGAPFGVRTNAVCPGNTLPGMQGDDPSAWRPTSRGVFATGDDVASAVAWLASDQAVHVNGATLRIDGATGAAFQAATRG